jgi:ankyrin repeat protein
MKNYLQILFLTLTVFLASCSIESRLFTALDNQDISKVKKTIEDGADVNCTKFYGNTPLLESAQMGNLELLEYLISKGANVNYQKNGFKLKSSKKIGDKLYEYSMEEIHNGGMTPLTAAIRFGKGDFVKIINYLLEKGANVNFSFINYNAQPIGTTGNFNYGIELGGSGTTLDEPTKEVIETPLTLAIEGYNFYYKKQSIDYSQKYKSIIQTLIKYGSDKNATDGDGKNAYQLATNYNLGEINDILK